MNCDHCGKSYIFIPGQASYCSVECQILDVRWKETLSNLKLGPAGKGTEDEIKFRMRPRYPRRICKR